MATVKKFLYQQLTDFLLTKLPKRYHNNFYSWMENGKLIDQGRNVTEYGVEIAHIQYDAILWFEAFPYKEINASMLMAHIQLWLNENDEMRCRLDTQESDFDLEIIDDNTADLSFTVSFREPLTAVKDEYGELQIGGENYRLDEIEIYYAEEVDVEAGLITNG